MKIIVQKFGGSVLTSIDDFKKVANVIHKRTQQGYHVCAVVSAIKKTTDTLLNLAKQLTNKPTLRELDVLASTGEIASASLLAICLNSLNIDATSFSGLQAGILTDSNFGNGAILSIDPTNMLKSLRKGSIPIIAGFQGFNEKNEVLTLGRGGSDLTAVAIAAALQAELVEFYKDVEGIYEKPPTIDSSTNIVINFLDYGNAIEVITQGHEVIYSKAVAYAEKHGVKLRVCSMDGVNDESRGTFIYYNDVALT